MGNTKKTLEEMDVMDDFLTNAMVAPLETVLALMIPAIIPFNVLKAGINGVITFFLYKSISHLMKGN